jgi:hypothetical protein
MANVLNEEKKQQVLALGRLDWPTAADPEGHQQTVSPLTE